MKQFKNYPIFINNADMEKIRLQQIEEYKETRDRQMMEDKNPEIRMRHYQENQHMIDWLESTGEDIFELQINEESHQSHNSRVYEGWIELQLQDIESTAIGKIILNSLNSQQKYWILPMSDARRNRCECFAETFRYYRPQSRGGIRSHYNPNYRTYDGKSIRITPAADLLHELTHAYRYGRVGYAGLNENRIPSWGGEKATAEEVFAHIMTNIYYSIKGDTKFYTAYNPYNTGDLEMAYENFATQADSLDVLKYYLDKEPLTSRIAGWNFPAYNPWRDYSILKSKYISRTRISFIRETSIA